MRVLPRVLIASLIMSVMSGTAMLRAAPPEGMPSPDDTWKLPNRDAMNANTVTVITAPAGGATSVFGSDMARVLDDGNIRVLPVLGKGPVHNVVDILNLKAIDMGMVVSDVPEFYRLQYKIPDITSQTALHREALQQRNPRRCADLCQIDLRFGGKADRGLDGRRLLRCQGDLLAP